MRIKPFDTRQSTSRPPEATSLLNPEQELDDGIEFDPKRDLRETDWNGMKLFLQRTRKPEGYHHFLKMAWRMFILFPERKVELNLEETWGELKERLDEYRQPQDWSSFGEMAVGLVLLFPERKGELGLDRKAWKGMKGLFDLCLEAQNWSRAGEMAFHICLLFPERKSEFNLETIWEGLRQDIEWYRHRPDSPGSRPDWLGVSTTTMYLALLFPDRKDEIVFDQSTWELMNGQIGLYRQKDDWRDLGAMAAAMTVLAAQDARITSDGQILIIPKRPRLSSAPSPLPARSHV